MTELDINARTTGEVTIIEIKGPITQGENSAKLRDARLQLKSTQSNILLNLGAVDFICASGLGELVNFYAKTHETGGLLVLTHTDSVKVDKRMSLTDWLVQSNFTKKIAVAVNEREGLLKFT